MLAQRNCKTPKRQKRSVQKEMQELTLLTYSHDGPSVPTLHRPWLNAKINLPLNYDMGLLLSAQTDQKIYAPL